MSGNDEIRSASNASESVAAGCVADGIKHRTRLSLNPTTGTSETVPDVWLEIEKAFRCELGRIKLRINLDLAFFYSAKLCLQRGCTAQQILGYAFGFFA